MKKLLFLVPFVLFAAKALHAQYTFGDVEVASMSEMFNPENNSLWGKKDGMSYRFNDEKSDIWEGSNLTGLVINDDNSWPNTVSFFAGNGYEPINVIEKVSGQLNKQFGKHKMVEIDNPIVIQGEKVNMRKWVHKENDISYEMMLGEVANKAILIIKQIEK